YIYEVARELERRRHLRVIRDGEGDSVRTEQLEDCRHEPRVVPELQREAHVRRQHADEAFEAIQVHVKIGLELEEERSQFFAEAERGVDDQIDRLLFAGEPLDVGDIAAALDRKEEAGWGLLSPGLKPLTRRLAVERVVELDGVEVLGIEREVFSCRHLLRIEALSPMWVRPARTADPDIACH